MAAGHAAGRKFRPGRAAGAVCAAAAACAAALLAAEGGLRLLGCLPGAADPDDDLGWRFVPGAFYRHTEEGFSEGRFNSLGFKAGNYPVEKPAGVVRTILLGDSFVEALQVDDSKTFARLAEQSLGRTDGRAEVIPFARSGMGTVEAWITLRRDALPFSPDVVCLVFLPANDIRDALPETTDDPLRPFARQTPEGVSITYGFRDSRGYKIRRWVNPVKAHSALLALMTRRYNAALRARRQPRLDPTDALFTANPDSLIVRAFEVNLAVMDEIRLLSERNGARFCLVVLPSYVYENDAELRQRGIDREAVDRRLIRWCADRDVSCLTLNEAFRRELRRAGVPLNFSAGGRWGHLNERGHQLVAGELAEFLRPLVAERRAGGEAARRSP